MDCSLFCIEQVIEKNNSVLIQTSEGNIFYEKLANTLHIGKEELKELSDKTESIKYNPSFESESLKDKKNELLESLVLNVTESCNFACSYCIYSGKYENERHENNLKMNFETARKAIDLFSSRSKNPSSISFYGGEPLNNFDLIREVIEYAKKTHPEKKFVFSMTSNFYNADKFLEDIIKNEIHVNISLDGPKEIHNKNRKLKSGISTYDKIIENVAKAKEISPDYTNLHIFYNATCENPDDLSTIIKFFQENEQFHVSKINMVEGKGLLGEEIKNPNIQDIFNLMVEYREVILSKKDPGILRKFFDSGLKDIALRNSEVMPTELMLNGACYPGNRKLFVDTDGQFYMCEKFGGRASIGDVNKGIEKNLVDNLIIKFLDIRNDYCGNCWAQRLCNLCIQSSKDPKEDISREGLAQSCNSNKSPILLALINYALLFKKNKKLLEEYILQLNKIGR
jgi:uncharacterized protein